MRRNWQIILTCVAFLVGIILSANFQFAKLQLFLIGIAALCVIALFFVKGQIGYLLFVIVGLTLGICRYEYYLQHKFINSTVFENQKVHVTGQVEGEPQWDAYRNYVFYIKNAKVNNQEVDGLIRIKTLTGNIYEGQVVSAYGKLKVGQGKAPTYISYAQTKVLESNQPFMVSLKSKFLSGLNTSLPTQSSAFISGILIGSKSALPKDSIDILTSLGLSHIVAVSGYNLTILVGFLNRRFMKNWRWGSLVSALWIILGFVLIAGGSPSIVRAGIMSALFLIVNYYGRRLSLVVCMSLVAVVMILIQPSSLVSDIGWQLSFASLLGITLLAPRISNILPSRPKLLNDILSVTLAAQLATAGLVVYKFGQFSVVAPLTNLLIMPIIPLLMLIGFVSAVVGLLLPQFSYIYFGKFVHTFIEYIFDLLTYISHWTFTAVKISKISAVTICVYYMFLIMFVLLIKNKNTQEYSFLIFENDKLIPENSYSQIKRKELDSVRSQ